MQANRALWGGGEKSRAYHKQNHLTTHNHKLEEFIVGIQRHFFLLREMGKVVIGKEVYRLQLVRPFDGFLL